MLKTVALVGIGGFIGSVARFLVSSTFNREQGFPFGTFAVNAFGCLLIGILAGLADRYDLFPEYRAFLLTGICGGFTTFSAFAIENTRLLQERDYLSFGVYCIISVVVCIAAATLGLLITKQ